MAAAGIQSIAHTGTRGFSLIEVVVVIVLMGLLAMAVIPVITTGVQTYQTTAAQLVTLSKLRYATERMAREIRAMRRNTVTPADYDISTMAATSIVFIKRDVVLGDHQVSITSAPPIVTLAYQAPAPAASATLTDQVGSLAFRYLDINGAVTASQSQLAFVEITLTLNLDGAALTQRTRVSLRNQL